jgi:hypothetical protein
VFFIIHSPCGCDGQGFTVLKYKASIFDSHVCFYDFF